MTTMAISTTYEFIHLVDEAAKANGLSRAAFVRKTLEEKLGATSESVISLEEIIRKIVREELSTNNRTEKT